MTTEATALLAAALLLFALAGVAVIVVVSRRRSTAVSAGDSSLLRRLDELHAVVATRDGTLDAQMRELDGKLARFQETMTGRQAALDEQMRRIDAQVSGLSTLFTNDRVRGGWAEIGLRRVFEHGGLVEGRDFTCQLGVGGVKPDAIVHLPGGRNIVVDAKFPIARFAEAMETDDPERRRALLAEHGKELERMGKSLGGKGYTELASGGYVVMYLPSQAVYEAAAAAHPELIDRLMASRVIVAGPTALYALIANVGALLTEYRALQQADQILDDARELHRRLAVFVGHFQAIGNGLGAAVGAFNGAVGSWASRVSPQLNRMSRQAGEAEMAPPAEVEEAVREPADPALRVAG